MESFLVEKSSKRRAHARRNEKGFSPSMECDRTETFNSLNSFIVNARIGYRKEDWEISIDVLNLFDQDDRDIKYFHESRLNSEPRSARVSDIHFQPIEPRQARLNIT